MLDPKIVSAVSKLSLAKSLLDSACEDIKHFSNTLKRFNDNESIYYHYKCLANVQDQVMSEYWCIGESEAAIVEINLAYLSDLGQEKNDDNAVNLALEVLSKDREENV